MWICIEKRFIFSDLGPVGNNPAIPSNKEDDCSTIPLREILTSDSEMSKMDKMNYEPSSF
jgi:hypothetical protein